MIVGLVVLTRLTLASDDVHRDPQWAVIDDGLSILSVTDGRGGGCRIAGMETGMATKTLPVNDAAPVSFELSTLGGESRRYFRHLSATPLVVVETLFGSDIGDRLPSLAHSPPLIPAEGWVDIIHPGWVWNLGHARLMAPPGLLAALTQCDLRSVDVHQLGLALSRLPASPRRATIAILNEWIVLDELALRPSSSWGQPMRPEYLGEARCLRFAACATYSRTWAALATAGR